MRIQRFFTTEQSDVYDAFDFAKVDFDLLTDDGQVSTTLVGIEVPADWDYQSVRILCGYLAQLPNIPAALKAVPEEKVPEWLWRKEIDLASLSTLPIDARQIRESSCKQMFNRVAGAWTYYGLKAGYFAGQEDAKAFFDETRFMLAARLFSPDLTQWRHVGFDWAYGLVGPEAEGWQLDVLKQRPFAGCHTYTQPEIASAGRQTILPEKIDALRYAKKIDRQIAPYADNHPHYRHPLAISLVHPQAVDLINWRDTERFKFAALTAGTRILKSQLENIRRATAVSDQPDLARLIDTARSCGIAESLIDMARDGNDFSDIALPTSDWQSEQDEIAGKHLQPIVVLHDQAADRQANSDADLAARWQQLTGALWRHGQPQIQYGDTATEWAYARGHQAALTAHDKNGVMFTTATAAPAATLNLMHFRYQDGGFDLSGFEHACRLLTIVLDIAINIGRYETEALARSALEYRPISIGFTNLHPLLLSQAQGYDSESGRAFAAAITALMTAQVLVTSSELAAKFGAFANFTHDRDSMLRIVRNQRRAVYGETTGYERITKPPLPLNLANCPDLALVAAARGRWDQALELGHTFGFRHAHVTGIARDNEMRDWLGADVIGSYPLSSLIQTVQIDTETFRRQLHPSVSDALQILGYDSETIKSLQDHAAGLLTLRGAPCINHATLLEHGLSYEAIDKIEDTLADYQDIRHAITPWLIGVDYCSLKLGINAQDIEDSAFDLLTVIGFSAADILAANNYCYGRGTLSDALHLQPHHRAIFTCAADGMADMDNGISAEGMLCMMAQLQPFISGFLPRNLMLPKQTTQKRIAALSQEAWRIGIKQIQITRDASWIDRPAATTEADHSLTDMAELGVSDWLPIVPSAPPQEIKRLASVGYMRSSLKKTPRGNARLKVRISEESALPTDKIN
jgi:ribonucleoside-diphosphate reductase alpha chain